MKLNVRLHVACLFFLLFVIPVTTTAQQVYHVNIHTGDDADDGLTWSTAFRNIQPAVDLAQSGDTIRVAAGTYYPTQKIADVYGGEEHTATPTNNRHRSFLLTKEIVLEGGYPAGTTDATAGSQRDWLKHQTILSGDFNEDDGDDFENTDENALHVVVMLNATSDMKIDGFYIQGGGGMDSATVYIRGIPIMYSCGGGIYAISDNTSSPTLTNLVIRDHKISGNGGGFFNYSNHTAAPVLSNVTMIHNVAETRGGAFYNYGLNRSAPVLLNVNITGNQASAGGGGLMCIAEKECAPRLENVLISGNKAQQGTGAYIIASEATAAPVITNTTISGNQATTYGGCGGLAVWATTGKAEPAMRNTVIWGNKSNGKTDNVFIEGESETNAVYTYSLIEGKNLGGTCLSGNTDPGFVNPVDAGFAPTFSDPGDYRLSSESPLIDKGDDSFVSLSEDLAGLKRIFGASVDLGAFEWQDDKSGNETLPEWEEQPIWSTGTDLYVKISNKNATVRVYSPNGMLIRQINNLSEGTHVVTLPKGLYIVTLSTGETAKIFIR